MKKKILAAIAAAVLLSGCGIRNEKQSGAGGIKLSPIIIKDKKEDSPLTSSALSEASDLSESTDCAANEVPQDLRWEEWEYIENLYTNASVNAKEAPFDSSRTVRVYEKNAPVSVVALTSTRYFKLDNGCYIPTENIYLGIVSNTETVNTGLIYDPPERIYGIEYDPKKALDYAKEHCEKEDTFCAEFASECIAAVY